MERTEVSLCAACDHCPTVAISNDGVRIGEAQNTVVLTHTEWNELVAKVHRGELTAI